MLYIICVIWYSGFWRIFLRQKRHHPLAKHRIVICGVLFYIRTSKMQKFQKAMRIIATMMCWRYLLMVVEVEEVIHKVRISP